MKKLFVITIIVFILWVLIVFIDYRRVHSFEMPIFCVGTELFDDGGSGRYLGLGYSFDIRGNFMPEDELLGITNKMDILSVWN